MHWHHENRSYVIPEGPAAGLVISRDYLIDDNGCEILLEKQPDHWRFTCRLHDLSFIFEAAPFARDIHDPDSLGFLLRNKHQIGPNCGVRVDTRSYSHALNTPDLRVIIATIKSALRSIHIIPGVTLHPVEHIRFSEAFSKYND